MKTPTQTLAAATLLLLAGCGGPILFAEVEIREVGITLPHQSFPAMTTLGGSSCGTTPNCAETDITFDIGNDIDVITQNNVTYDLKLTDLHIVADTTTTGADLSGIVSADVVVVPADGGAPVVVATYTRPTGGGPITTLAVSSVETVDLEPFIQSGTLHLQVRLVYDAPTPAFTASIQGVFYLKAKIDYGKELGVF